MFFAAGLLLNVVSVFFAYPGGLRQGVSEAFVLAGAACFVMFLYYVTTER
jgi:hypothetical protein